MGTGSAMEAGPSEQLAAVRANLQTRLTEGVSRVLEAMRVAEDKARLADNSLSLLRHVLSDSLHLPKKADSPVQMHVITSRAVSSRADSDAMEIDGTTVPPEDDLQEDTQGCEDILRSVVLDQSVDDSQQYLLIAVHGVLSEYAWSTGEKRRAPLCMRLEVEVQSSTSMQWDVGYVQVQDPGEQVRLFARTPWQCVVSNAAGGDDNLRVYLEVRLDDDRKQHLGAVTILSPAALLQKKVLVRRKGEHIANSPRVSQWLPEEETLVAIGDDQRITVFEPNDDGMRTEVSQNSSVTKVVVSAPTAMTMASYFNAVRLSVSDTAQLQFLAASKKYVSYLKHWVATLRQETEGLRRTSASSCSKGLEKSAVAELMNLQIALDEACGIAKETIALEVN